MAEEANLDVARRWLDWGAHQLVDDHFMELLDERCDYYPARQVAGATPCHGVEEVRRWLTQFRDAWDIWEVRVLDVEALPGDRVIAQTHVRGIGKGSGLDIDGDIFHVFWMRHGRILRLEDYLSERAARRALGL